MRTNNIIMFYQNNMKNINSFRLIKSTLAGVKMFGLHLSYAFVTSLSLAFPDLSIFFRDINVKRKFNKIAHTGIIECMVLLVTLT